MLSWSFHVHLIIIRNLDLNNVKRDIVLSECFYSLNE